VALSQRANVQTTNSAGTTVTLNKNTGISNGDLLFAMISFRGGTGVTISTPSGLTATTRFNNGTDNVSTVCFWRVVDGSEGASYAWTLGSSQSYEGTMIAIQADSAPALIDDINGQSNGAGLGCTAPSISPVGSADFLVFIAAACRNTAVTAQASTPPSGYAEVSDLVNSVTTAAGNLSQEVATKTLSSSGATGTAVNAYSNLHRSVGVHVAFKETPAATYAPPPSNQIRLPFSILAR
jgi:hypothetical protein